MLYKAAPSRGIDEPPRQIAKVRLWSMVLGVRVLVATVWGFVLFFLLFPFYLDCAWIFCTAFAFSQLSYFFTKPQMFRWPSELRACTAWAQKKPSVAATKHFSSQQKSLWRHWGLFFQYPGSSDSFFCSIAALIVTIVTVWQNDAVVHLTIYKREHQATFFCCALRNRWKDGLPNFSIELQKHSSN